MTLSVSESKFQADLSQNGLLGQASVDDLFGRIKAALQGRRFTLVETFDGGRNAIVQQDRTLAQWECTLGMSPRTLALHISPCRYVFTDPMVTIDKDVVIIAGGRVPESTIICIPSVQPA